MSINISRTMIVYSCSELVSSIIVHREREIVIAGWRKQSSRSLPLSLALLYFPYRDPVMSL